MPLIFSLFLGIIIIILSMLLQKYTRYPSSIWFMTLGFLLVYLIPELKLFTDINTKDFSNILLATLPFLLTADVLDLKMKIVKKNLFSIFLLAVVSVILSIILGYIAAPYVFSGYNLSAGEIIFTNVACFATDPVAVISIFDMFLLPYTLKTLVEGESLGNDGTAIILAVYLGLPLMAINHEMNIIGFSLNSITVILGSIFIGIIFGSISFLLLYLKETQHWNTIVWGFSSIGAFIFSEYWYIFQNLFFHTHSHFHFSGIVSSIIASITLLTLLQKGQDFLENKQQKEENFLEQLNKERKFKFNNKTVKRIIRLLKTTVERRNVLNAVKENFHFFALLANSLLFIYLGELLSVHLNLLIKYSDVIIKMVIITLLIRGIVMALFAFVSNMSNSLVNISFHWWFILTFVGFQGGLSVVLSSILPETIPNYDLIISVILGNILLSTLINATALIIYISINKNIFKEEYKKELELN